MRFPCVVTVFSLLAALTLSARASGPAVQLAHTADLSGWEFISPTRADMKSLFHDTAAGTISAAGTPIGYLATKGSYGDYRLHVAWRFPANAAKNSNGGILLHIASGPKDREWPVCIQVQTKPGRAGDILPMAGATFAEKLSTAPGAKIPQLDRRSDASENAPGQWNECEILSRGGTIEVSLNGFLVNRITDVNPGAGKIGLQFEGAPYELRDVTLTPLD